MNSKLLILFIALIVFLGFVISSKQPLKFLFWFGVSCFFVRTLSTPFINEVNISYMLLTFLILLNPKILLNRKQLKEWGYWYFVILVGILNSLFFGQSKDFFKNQDVLIRAFDWSTKFFLVIFVSSSITYYVKTEKDLKKLMYFFLMSCFILSFTATIAFFGLYDGLLIFGSDSFTNIQDFSSDTIYSVVYGISSSNLVFGVSALSIVFIPYLSWNKFQKYLFLIIIVFSIVISLKRLAIVTLVLASIYYLLIEKKKGNNNFLLIIALLVLFIGTSYFALLSKRFLGAFNSFSDSGITDSSSDIRIDRYNLAWELFLNNPLLGQGAGYLIFIHNGFLEILGNLGILGLVLFKPLIRPLKNLKTLIYNPWAVSLILVMITLVTLEAAINRVEIMYFVGLLYGGFLASISIKSR